VPDALITVICAPDDGWSYHPRKVAETGPYLSSLADFTHCIFRSLTSAWCCNYSYMCSWWWVELPPAESSRDGSIPLIFSWLHTLHFPTFYKCQML